MNNSLIGTAHIDDIAPDVVYGTVRQSGTNPLTVTVDLSLTLGKTQLVIPKHLMSQELTFTVDDATYTVTTNGALVDGARVVLLREGGGQRYIVLGVTE